MPAPQAVLDLIERFDRNLVAALTEHEQPALQRRIDATDRQPSGRSQQARPSTLGVPSYGEPG